MRTDSRLPNGHNHSLLVVDVGKGYRGHSHGSAVGTGISVVLSGPSMLIGEEVAIPVSRSALQGSSGARDR